MKYPINEVFASLQSEGAWTGTPSVFIRLQGCDVGCKFCDTKHTWKLNSFHEIKGIAIEKKEDSHKYEWLTSYELLELCKQFSPKHIVLTGGEPCMYDLTKLTNCFINNGYTLQIETSGTEKILANELTWITCSPKFNMPAGKEVLQEALDRANEIKMPVGEQADIEQIKTYNFNKPIYLQPLDTKEKATKICIEEAAKNGWKVSIQYHKFLGIR